MAGVEVPCVNLELQYTKIPGGKYIMSLSSTPCYMRPWRVFVRTPRSDVISLATVAIRHVGGDTKFNKHK